MIISQTPYRISFFGGGTDYPAWYLEHGGNVLSTSINKYCYLSCRQLPPFFEHNHRIVYSIIECVKNIADIKHPVVREVFKFLKVNNGLEVHYDGDLPARSGIGSSSSFTVGLLNSLYALQGQMISKNELAKLALYVEQSIIGEAVGSQDQIAAAYGGLNKISFHQNGQFTVDPVIISSENKQSLSDHLLLFFTGFSRIAEKIAKSQIENFAAKKSHLMSMSTMVDEGIKILQRRDGNLDDFGLLLNESWQLKRELSNQVTNQDIDDIYNLGISNGATGGKILGAGGGGFIMFYAKPHLHQNIRQALEGLIEVDFEFENKGSHITYYHPEKALYRHVDRRLLPEIPAFNTQSLFN